MVVQACTNAGKSLEISLLSDGFSSVENGSQWKCRAFRPS